MRSVAVQVKLVMLAVALLLVMHQGTRAHRHDISWSFTPLVTRSGDGYALSAEDREHAVGYLHLHVRRSALDISGVWLWGDHLVLDVDEFVPDPKVIPTIPPDSIAEVARQKGLPARESERLGQMIAARRKAATFVSWPAAVGNLVAFGIVLWLVSSLIAVAFRARREDAARRRGGCLKCGYDLTGLADPAAPCPECGGAR